jgi:dTDP-glucose 4,6-dehydratase
VIAERTAEGLVADDADRVNAHVPQTWDALRGARIFLTGGTGFFGTWLLETLVRANATHGVGASAVVLTRDAAAFRRKAPHLADDRAVAFHAGDVRTFAAPGGAFTHVVHGATAASAALNAAAPGEMFDTIVDGTRHVLDVARARGATRVLLVSSGAVYGRQPGALTHVPETFEGGPDPLDPGQAYAEGKRAAELLGASASRLPNGPAVTIARCFAFVGPHLPLDAHFAIGNFIRDALAGGPIRLTGDGTPWRSYLYAADLAAWLWTILARGEAGRAYNVGSADARDLWETAHVVARAAGGCDVTRASTPRPGALAPRYVPDATRARTELGLAEWTPLEPAVERSLAWAGPVRRRTVSVGLRTTS